MFSTGAEVMLEEEVREAVISTAGTAAGAHCWRQAGDGRPVTAAAGTAQPPGAGVGAVCVLVAAGLPASAQRLLPLCRRTLPLLLPTCRRGRLWCSDDGGAAHHCFETCCRCASSPPAACALPAACCLPAGAGAFGVLMTAVLPTTVEDLLALSLAAMVGYVSILNLPMRRAEAKRKLEHVTNTFAQVGGGIPPGLMAALCV